MLNVAGWVVSQSGYSVQPDSKLLVSPFLDGISELDVAKKRHCVTGTTADFQGAAPSPPGNHENRGQKSHHGTLLHSDWLKIGDSVK